MSDVKIITYTKEIYQTSDGEEFESKIEAERWQKVLDNMPNITMLNSRFEITSEVDSTYYVYLKDQEQTDAFNKMQQDLGIVTLIANPGYHYYNEVSDEYLNIEDEINRLTQIKNILEDNANS